MATAEPARGWRAWWWVLALVAIAAFLLRLVPVLRGGGLWGLLGYDGGVYYTAAAGLARGLVPYRDFLLLHPPGITVALLPFGLLGRVVGDADTMAAARLAWMGLGAVSAVLVSLVLRSHGRLPALVGGLAYAAYVPNAYVERTTALEAVTGVCTVAAVALLTRPGHPGTWTFLLAGALLGASTGVKIWGIAVLLVVVVWCAFAHRLRAALLMVAGAGVALVAICLPFFLAAPVRMWQMVVLAQLGRPRVEVSLGTKLTDIGGLTKVEVGTPALVVLLAVEAVLGVIAVVLALRTRAGRLGVVLLGASLALLVASPAWSTDYASLLGVPLALVLGSAVGVLGARRARAGRVTGVVALAGLTAYTAASLPNLTFGPSFAGRTLGRLLADTPGCVVTDEPSAIVEADLLQRNLDRGCPLMADLGGYSYHLQPGAGLHVGRARNEQWQRFTLDHFRTGDAVVVVRFAMGTGFSRETKATIAGWPLIGSAGRFEVRRPLPASP